MKRVAASFLALGAAACASGAGRSPAALSPRDQLTRFIDSSVADARFRSAQWGILIVDPERGDTLYSRNAGKLFMPASNQKLLTGAVALDVLGPGYRYSTHFAAGGAILDALSDQSVEAVYAQAAPRYAGSENDGLPTDDIVTIEANLTRCRIDTSDRARDQYLRSEPPRLLEGAARKFVA